MNIPVPARTLAEMIDVAMTDLLGQPASMALKFHIAKMTGASDACALAVEDPAAFEGAVARLFGGCSAALLDRLTAYLFRTIVPASHSGTSHYAIRGPFAAQVRQLRGAHVIKNAMLEMKDRDHVIAYYSSPFQLEQMVYHFVARGLKSNQIAVMAVSRPEEHAFREFLKVNGMDVDGLIETQDILIVPHDELYPAGPDSSFEPILGRLHAAKGLLESKKRTGLNIIGTVAGNLAMRGQHEKCFHIEQAWHRTVQDYAVPITLLCPYQEGSIESEAPLIKCHSRGVHSYR